MRDVQDPKGDYVRIDELNPGDLITWSWQPDYLITAIEDKPQRKGANRRLLVSVTDIETNAKKVMEIRADSRAVRIGSNGKTNG